MTRTNQPGQAVFRLIMPGDIEWKFFPISVDQTGQRLRRVGSGRRPLVPFEAMVKHPRNKFPRTNGWEFFALEVSGTSTKATAALRFRSMIRRSRSFSVPILGAPGSRIAYAGLCRRPRPLRPAGLFWRSKP